jgi:hypothetical protein
MDGVDPFSQISLEEDPLFLDFVLESEAQIVNASREDVNVFVELNMSLRAVNAIAQDDCNCSKLLLGFAFFKAV